MLNGGPVSWKSTRQKSVSLSTAESEWYAASEAGKEILYLRFILHDFGFSQEEPTPLYPHVSSSSSYMHVREPGKPESVETY